MNRERFLRTLFDEGEFACFTPHHRGVAVSRVVFGDTGADGTIQFMSLNPLHPTMDREPVEEWHSILKPRRADVNVWAYRNILIEIDSLPDGEQMDYIQKLGMPYSTVVHSGGKSLHFIIALDAPLPDKRAYDDLVRRIHSVVTAADPAAKNCSRLTRFPGHFRQDKQRTQELLYVGNRIPLEVLERWLSEHYAPKEEIFHSPERMKYEAPSIDVSGKRRLNAWTRNYLMMGASEGERNTSLFRAACDAARCGYSEEEFISLAATSVEELGREGYTTVRSAFRRA